MWIGRAFIPITLVEGDFAVGDIGRGIISWVYDEELDGEGVPFY